MNCIRCGRSEQIESHHIKAKVDGGGDESENKEPRCSACHDFEHAKRNILKMLERERGQLNRIMVLELRLKVLEKWNTPELIRERGTYQTYWIDEATHDFPRYERIQEKQNNEANIQQGVFNLA